MSVKPQKLKVKAVTLYGAVALLIVVLHVICRLFPKATDFYIRYIFPVFTGTIGRFSGLFPFAVGDVLLAFTAFFILYVVVLGIVTIFARHKMVPLFKKVIKVFAWYALFVVLILTLNWWLLYQATPFKDKYMREVPSSYTNQELLDVCKGLVSKANGLAKTIDRDDNGVPVTTTDLMTEARRLLTEIAEKERIKELSGFYPKAKTMLFSEFFSQQYISGYYFPVTIEANINGVMADINKPFVICHELAHLKGLIREDEANFVGYMACMNSTDPYFVYSGLLEIIPYLQRDLQKSGVEENKIPKLSAKALADDVFLTPEAWEKVEEKAVVSTEVVHKVSQTLVDTSLKANGVEEGIASYGRVTELVMAYETKQDRTK